MPFFTSHCRLSGYKIELTAEEQELGNRLAASNNANAGLPPNMAGRGGEPYPNVDHTGHPVYHGVPYGE